MSNFPLPALTGLRTVAIDFDDVLAKGTWPSPDLGEPIPLGVEALNFYYDNDYEVVVFTSRPASHAERIWRWLDDQGLKEKVYDVVCTKIRAAIYLDDRAIRFPDGVK